MKLLQIFLFFIMGSGVCLAATPKCIQGNKKLWFIHNGGNIIGDSNQGYSSQSACDSLFQASLNGNIVCAWNGQNFQMYNYDNGTPLGGAEAHHYYKDDSLCISHAKMQKSSQVVCQWNGSNYAPYSARDNKALSAPENGFTSIEECLNSIDSKLPLACGWDGGSYLYNLSGGKQSPLMSNPKDMSTRNCKEYLNVVSDKFKANKKAVVVPPPVDLGLSPTPYKSDKPNSGIGLPWKSCEMREMRYHILRSENGFISPECAPDTLFSWGSFPKLNWFIQNLSRSKAWIGKFPRPLFSTLSPSSTFGYGIVPIRIKIKPSVKFKFFVNPGSISCDSFSGNTEEWGNTVFVRYAELSQSGSIVDYIICSSSVIESWSYYTAKHYDEILRDFNWNMGPDFKLYNTYYKENSRGVFLESTLDQTVYGTDFSRKSFNERMNFYRWSMALGLGEVFAAPGQNFQEKIKQHFKTKTPSYYNWNE